MHSNGYAKTYKGKRDAELRNEHDWLSAKVTGYLCNPVECEEGQKGAGCGHCCCVC